MAGGADGPGAADAPGDAGAPRGAEEPACTAGPAIAVVGATATGKTAVAIAVARAVDGEVISVDSRQAYRGMAVGTAAPTARERAAVPHHGVAFLEPGERYSAGRFARLARGWMAEIRGRGRVPVLAGGTGFFLRALTDPVFREPAMDPGRRRALRRWLKARPTPLLVRWARRADPALARRLDDLDRQRAARTLELALLSGRPLSWFHDHGEPEAPPVNAACYLLWLPRDAHRERIARRAGRQLDAGWPEEARRLREAVDADAPALSAVGYREALALAEGEATRGRALERIVARTWQYARRQRTWFRHQLPETAVRLDATEPTGQLARRIVRDWRERAGGPAVGGEGEGRAGPSGAGDRAAREGAGA